MSATNTDGPSIFRMIAASTLFVLCVDAKEVMHAIFWGIASTGYFIAMILHLLVLLTERRKSADKDKA